MVDVKEGADRRVQRRRRLQLGRQLLFNVRIQENNLFGRGQRLVLNADFGSIRRNNFIVASPSRSSSTRR